MSKRSAEYDLQAAVVSALIADAFVYQEVGARVYDHAPEGAQFPYLTIGPTETAEFDTCTSLGQDHQVMVSVWSQYLGQAEAKRIQNVIYNALHRCKLPVAGHTLVVCLQEYSDVTKDPDGVTHHGVQRFRVLTEMEE